MPRCTAKAKSTGNRCKNDAIRGSNVCRVHGGAAPQVKNKARQRLLEAADPAAAELVKIATAPEGAVAHADRIKAIKEILDRADVPRTEKREVMGEIEQKQTVKVFEVADDWPDPPDKEDDA